MAIPSSDFTYLPFIHNMDVPFHKVYMNIAIRDDLKSYSTSKHIQSDENETDHETFKQKGKIKSQIHEDISQSSVAQTQSTDNSTTAKSRESKDEMATTKFYKRETQSRRCNEVKSFSNLFAAHGTLQEIMYFQIDDLTIKDVFLSSIIEWTFSEKDKGQPKNPSKDTFDFIFYMKCDQGSLRRDIQSTIQSNLYSNIPALQGLAQQAMVNENYKCLLVIDVPEELNLELNVALRAKFCSIFANATIIIIFPFIDMVKVGGKLDEHERVVHVFKTDKRDISEMIGDSVYSKPISTYNVLDRIAIDIVNDIRWESFSNDSFLISLLFISQQTPSEDDSITQFMTNTTNQLLQNGVKNRALSVDLTKQFLVDTKRNETLQRFINQYETISQYLPILLTLGLIAYENLTGEHKSKEPTNKLDEYQRKIAIRVGVQVGLLRKTENESSTEFLHDIFQDFFAALWTVEREMFKEFVDESCKSLQHVSSKVQYLTFLVGLDQRYGPVITQHIADLCEKDDRISEYRQTLGVSPVVAEMNTVWIRISMEKSLTNGKRSDQHSALVLSDVEHAYQNRYSNLDHLTAAMKEAIISLYLDDVTINLMSYSGSDAFVTFLQQCPNIQKLALTCEALDIFQKKGTNALLPSLHVLHVQSCRRYDSLPVDWLVLQNVTSLSLCRITFSSHKDKRRFECFVESLKSLKELQLEEIDPEEEMSVRVSSHLKSLTLKIVSLAEIDIQIVSSLESIVVDTVKCSDTEVVKIISYIQETNIIKECDIDFPMILVRTDIHMLLCKFLRHLRLKSSSRIDTRFTRISETLPYLTVCYLSRLILKDSACRVLETALYSASSLEVLKIDNIKTEWMSVDLRNSIKLRSLTVHECPVVQMLFCTKSLEIIDIDRRVYHTKQVLNSESKIIHDIDKNVGCMTIEDKHARLNICNSGVLKVLKLDCLGLKICDIQINVEQLETITMKHFGLDDTAYVQLENIMKRARKVKYCTLHFQSCDRIMRVNLLNCVYLQSLTITDITNVSFCPRSVRTLRLSDSSIRTMKIRDHVDVSNISELLDLIPFTRLKKLELKNVGLGDGGLLLTSFNVLVNKVKLEDIHMSLSGWFTFVQSLLNVDGHVDVKIRSRDADIPDQILNIILSSVMFRISYMDLRDRWYKIVDFEKFERPDWRKHRHGYSTKRMLPRVVKPVKQYYPIVSSSEGMITPMTFQGEIIKKLSDSHVMKSTKPLSEKSYTVRQSLPGDLIKKSKRELMKLTTPDPKEEV